MQRTRCADDFAAIRARMQELQHERQRAVRKSNDEPTESSFGQRTGRFDPPRTQERREELFRPPRRLG